MNASAQVFDLAPLLRWLGSPAAYAKTTRRVERIETHISWVFLTDRHVYKLKKPVKFEFLDFSELELRHQACEDEVRLNRRLAPDVYLGVVPITRTPRGHFALGGKGQVVDWLVKMRRLPADRALDQLIQRGALRDDEIESLAACLAEYYRSLPPVSIQGRLYCDRVERHVTENYRELVQPEHGMAEDTPEGRAIKGLHAAQVRLLRTAAWLFERRVCDGRIADAHGDLRPEHVYLLSRPVVIDCVEFSSELRQVDVLDELCFLRMECDVLGEPRIGRRMVEEYCRVSGDAPPSELISFYLAYRACVRAKVELLRASQIQEPPHGSCVPQPGDVAISAAKRASERLDLARRYLRLAGDYCRGLGTPLLFVVRGVSGTGKSTTAKALAEHLWMTGLATDPIRQELWGRAGMARAGPIEFNQECYTPAARERVYQEMYRRAEPFLAARVPCVLDGTFLTTAECQRAAELAHRHQFEPIFIQCTCPDEIAAERIQSRWDQGETLSEARPDFVARQRQLEEPLPSGLRAYTIDTTRDLSDILQEVSRIAAIS